MNNIYYLDIEIKKREFLSRVYLGCKLVEKGGIAFVGPRLSPATAKRIASAGLVVRKSSSPNEIRVINDLKLNNFQSVSADEEGLLVSDLERFATLRHSHETVDSVKAIFSWGKNQNDYLKDSYPIWKDKFFETGNPRVELWKNSYFGYYDSLADEIKSYYGEFVIVPSNFALYTNEDLCKKMMSEAGYFDKEEGIVEYNKNLSTVRFLFDEFILMIREIVATGIKVVFRPHPSDDIDFIKKRVSGIKGVFIKSEHDIAPWIIASNAVIHNCCTTAVEAFLMDKKVISFCPDNISQYSIDNVNYLSLRAVKTSEVIDCLNLNNKIDKDFTMGGFLTKNNSIETSVGLLHEMAVKGDVNSKRNDMSDFKYNTIFNTINFLRYSKDKFIFNPKLASERKTMRAKFPLTKPKELREFISFLHERNAVKNNIRVTAVGDNIFMLTQ